MQSIEILSDNAWYNSHVILCKSNASLLCPELSVMKHGSAGRLIRKCVQHPTIQSLARDMMDHSLYGILAMEYTFEEQGQRRAGAGFLVLDADGTM